MRHNFSLLPSWRFFFISILLLIVFLNPFVFYFILSPLPIKEVFFTTKKILLGLILIDGSLIFLAIYIFKNKSSSKELLALLASLIFSFCVAELIAAKSLRRVGGVRHNTILQHEAFKGAEGVGDLKRSLELYENNAGRTRSKFNTLYFFDVPHFSFPNYSSTRVFDAFTIRSSRNFSSSSKKKIVWFLGGSTMYSMYTLDSDTIPSIVSRLSAESNISLEPYNFGVSGNNISYELVNMIQLLKKSTVSPDLIVFYDGYNDSATSLAFGETHHSVRKILAPPIEYPYLQNASYNLVAWLNEKSVIFGLIMGERLMELFVSWKYDLTPEHILKIASNYTQSIEFARAIAKSRNIETIFFLQPMLFTKRHIAKSEMLALDPPSDRAANHVYDQIRFTNKNKPYFVDISNCFDHVAGPVYFDNGHVSSTGNKIIAKKIFSTLVESGLLNN